MNFDFLSFLRLSNVRGQNRGSWIFPIYLDYFQLADMCISLVFTWFYAQNLSNCQAPGTGQVQIQVMPLSSFMSRFKSTTNSKLKFQSHNLKSRDLERHYNQMSHPPTHHPLNFSKLKISSFQSYPPGSGPGWVPT